MASPPFPSPTKTYHQTSYPAISPTRSELSQQGQNVFITGAGTGIGREIALSFAHAHVSNLALVGRRLEPLEETKQLISSTFSGSSTKVHLYTADIADESAISRAFDAFASDISGPIHTCVANAGVHTGVSKVLEESSETLLKSLNLNVVGTANTIKAYMRHLPTEPNSTGKYKGRFIHTSTGVAHAVLPMIGSYGLGKGATLRYLGQVALEEPDVQVISFHPGIIETAMNDLSKEQGIDLQPKDDISLPADWTLWAASKESAFLGSGRLIWAHWDIDELREVFGRMEAGKEQDGVTIMGVLPVNQRFTVGLIGWPDAVPIANTTAA